MFRSRLLIEQNCGTWALRCLHDLLSMVLLLLLILIRLLHLLLLIWQVIEEGWSKLCFIFLLSRRLLMSCEKDGSGLLFSDWHDLVCSTTFIASPSKHGRGNRNRLLDLRLVIYSILEVISKSWLLLTTFIVLRNDWAILILLEPEVDLSVADLMLLLILASLWLVDHLV